MVCWQAQIPVKGSQTVAREHGALLDCRECIVEIDKPPTGVRRSPEQSAAQETGPSRLEEADVHLVAVAGGEIVVPGTDAIGEAERHRPVAGPVEAGE